ncbi:hypothetical protein MASR1M12_05480 [Erysipelotrichia bacterium]
MKNFKLFALVMLLSGWAATAAQAANPVVRYFSRLLDETRAEKAIDELLLQQFSSEMPENIHIASDSALTARMRKLAENSSRPDIAFQVLVIESDVVDEIPMPGGTLLLTSGLLSSATGDEQRDFILARNIMHIVLKHPMRLIKQEGLYPALLNQLKLVPERRNREQMRTLVRDYLRNMAKMNHKKADLQGILLTSSPENTRKAAISLLGSFSVRLWPVSSWDTGDLPSRISELEKLKLPE